MAFWADGITKAWHLEKRKVHVASLTNTTHIITSSLPVSGERWVWIMKRKYLTRCGSSWDRKDMFELITSIKKNTVSCIYPHPFYLLRRWGMSTGRTTTRPEAATGSWLSSIDPQKYGTRFRRSWILPTAPPSLPILILQQHYNFLSAADALFLCLTMELFNISAGVQNKEGFLSFLMFFFSWFVSSIDETECSSPSVSA